MSTQKPSIPVGGTFSSRNNLYVERAIDEHFSMLTTDGPVWLNVYGCRAMGKSSLVVRHEEDLRARGFRVIYVDVAGDIGEHKMETPLAWTTKLAEAIASSLGFRPSKLTQCLTGLSDNALAAETLETLFVEGVCRVCPTPIFLVLDEYDYIKNMKFVEDLIVGLKRLKTKQAQYPDSPLARLSVCLVGWRPITQLLDENENRDVTAVAPFAQLLEIEDFSQSDETVAALSKVFPDDCLPDKQALEKLLFYSGGQPLVTMDLLERMTMARAVSVKDLDALIDEVTVPPDGSRGMGLFHAISNRIATWGAKGHALLNTYIALKQGSHEAYFSPGADLLILTGLVRRRDGRLEVKGELFHRCFDLPWANRTISRIASNEHRFLGGSTSKKKILLINTGGTLGMVERDGQVVAPENEKEYKDYFQALGNVADVTYRSLFPPRDSINVFPDQWAAIARWIYEYRHQYDGVVVAHGTDTMADTSSAVAFALGPHLDFPVVFTGAQTTPDVAHGDAHANLYRACEVAKHDVIKEVVICFGNFVYRAVRAQKVDDRRFDGFESPTYPPLAEITGEINIRPELIRPLPKRKREMELRAHFATGIMLIPQFPGLEPAPYLQLLRENFLNGVILQTRGAGNVASADPYSFIPFVHEAFSRGVPVVVTSQYPPDPGSHTRYRPAQAPLEVGAINAGNMTLGAAATKFRWVLGDVLNRKGWSRLSPTAKRDLVSQLMVGKPLVGEF